MSDVLYDLRVTHTRRSPVFVIGYARSGTSLTCRLLRRYLEHGLGGTAGKNPVQISVTIHESTIGGQPGAPPAREELVAPRARTPRSGGQRG